MSKYFEPAESQKKGKRRKIKTYHYSHDVEKFETRNEFGLIVPKLYGERRDDLSKFIGEMGVKSASGNVLLEQDVRRLWAGTFISNASEESVECLRILREQVDMGLTAGAKKYLEETDKGHWGFGGPSQFTLKDFESKDEKDNPFLRFGKEQVIVISNMVASMPTTPLVIEILRGLGSGAVPFVLVGNSKNGETRFEDGKVMQDEFFVHPSELKILQENKDKVALVVDDTEISGKTYRIVREGLEKIGYGKIYKIATTDGNLLGQKGESLNNRGFHYTSYAGSVWAKESKLGDLFWTAGTSKEGRGGEYVSKRRIAIIGGGNSEDSLGSSRIIFGRKAWKRSRGLARALGAELAENGFDVVTRERNNNDLLDAVSNAAWMHGAHAYEMNDSHAATDTMPVIPIKLVEAVDKERGYIGGAAFYSDLSVPNAVMHRTDAVIVMGWNRFRSPVDFAFALAGNKVVGVLEDRDGRTERAHALETAAKDAGLQRDFLVIHSGDPQELVKEIKLQLAMRDSKMSSVAKKAEADAEHDPEYTERMRKLWGPKQETAPVTPMAFASALVSDVPLRGNIEIWDEGRSTAAAVKEVGDKMLGLAKEEETKPFSELSVPKPTNGFRDLGEVMDYIRARRSQAARANGEEIVGETD